MSIDNSTNKETFGQRLSRLRKNKNLTQEEIAEKVNVSPQAVSKWENDITSPDIDTLIRLSDILSVSLDELMGKKTTTTEVKMTDEKERKNFNKLMLKIRIIDGKDKVNVNLPVVLIKMLLESGKEIPISMGNDAIKNVDFNSIIELAEQGVMGELISIEGEDGEKITVTVE